MPKLFADDDDDQDDDIELKTNTDYATNYDTWRQKEEFNKLKTKYGEAAAYAPSDDETSSSDDDDDGQQISEEFERNFFKTLSYLKKKDPRIYDQNQKFFSEDDFNNRPSSSKKEDKPMFLKDYERKMILQHGAKFGSDSEEETEEHPRSQSPTYVEEQQRLKESFKKAITEDEAEEDENWGGLFQKRSKSTVEQQKEEEDYREWLKGQKENLDNANDEQELTSLKNYWNNPKLSKDERFLRDYVLNKKYLDTDDKNYIPTYDEIVHDSDENLSEDEKAVEQQEEFEHKYNYRFEEPDQEFIKRYPRTMDHSVRKTDDKRKQKRAEIKKRKEEEKQQKKEELRQLKLLKRKEIQEKIEKLKEITGNKDIGFHGEDLEEDFNPEEYDKRMNELFNDNYYDQDEGDYKPEFPDLDEELGPWKNDGPHCEDEDFNMDCDYDPTTKSEEPSGSKKKKRNRYDKKKAKLDDEDNEDLEEDNEEYQKYMDEYYKLDCEDMIGDIPCRFKYREVVPNSFGLTIGEILLAKDRELNRWCSLKKAVQYRPDHIEKYDVVAYGRKAQNEALKRKMLPSLYEELDDDEPARDKDNNINNEQDALDESAQEKDNITDNEEDTLDESAENNEESKDNTEESSVDNDNIENKLDESVENSEENKDNVNKEETKSKKRRKRKRKSSNTITEGTNKNEDATKKNDTSTENSLDKSVDNKNNVDKQETNSTKRRKRKRKSSTTITEGANKNKDASKESNVNTENSLVESVDNKNNVNKVELNSKKKRKRYKKSRNTSTGVNKSIINATVSKNNSKPNQPIGEAQQKSEAELENDKLSRRQKRNKKKKVNNSAIETPIKKQAKKRKLSVNGSNKKSKKRKVNNNSVEDLSKSRLEAYGINPKKFKNKLKYKVKK